MAKAKEFTITVDNRPGAVLEIAKTLGDAKVNILALLGTVHGNVGTIRLVAENPARAKKALDDARISYEEMPAEQIEIANKPGTLAECLGKLAAKGISLGSICATSPKGGRKSVVVYTIEAAPKAAAATA